MQYRHVLTWDVVIAHCKLINRCSIDMYLLGMLS
jgi:hypothetical protein